MTTDLTVVAAKCDYRYFLYSVAKLRQILQIYDTMYYILQWYVFETVPFPLILIRSIMLYMSVMCFWRCPLFSHSRSLNWFCIGSYVFLAHSDWILNRPVVTALFDGDQGAAKGVFDIRSDNITLRLAGFDMTMDTKEKHGMCLFRCFSRCSLINRELWL